MTSVSVLGLGAMGRALAGALRAFELTVWNRTPGRAPDLAARRAATAEEAVAAADVVVVCLLDDAAARATVPLDALGDRVLVNLTSVSPAGARWWAERVPTYVSGGMIAVPEAVGGDDAIVLASGTAAAYERARPVLEALGRPLRLGDDPALAPAYDMALVSGMYGVFAGAQHAVALVDSVGGDAGAFVGELMVPWLGGMLPFVAGAANPRREVPEELRPAQQAVSLRNLLAAGEVQGVPRALAGHLDSALAVMEDAAP